MMFKVNKIVISIKVLNSEYYHQIYALIEKQHSSFHDWYFLPDFYKKQGFNRQLKERTHCFVFCK